MPVISKQIIYSITDRSVRENIERLIGKVFDDTCMTSCNSLVVKSQAKEYVPCRLVGLSITVTEITSLALG